MSDAVVLALIGLCTLAIQAVTMVWLAKLRAEIPTAELLDKVKCRMQELEP